MAQVDSLDKVISTYFAMVCAAPFEYKGKRYEPRKLRVSPMLFRGFTCPAGCGGCCPRFSLDYLPAEDKPEGVILSPRVVSFDGRDVTVYSDLQADRKGERFCRNLEMSTGRCNIHGRQPFSCDFELIRFLEFSDQKRPNNLTQKLFGRGWAMMRVDGERGALCEMLPVTDETVAEVRRKLTRLEQWAAHFGVETKVPAILDWVDNGDRARPFLV